MRKGAGDFVDGGRQFFRVVLRLFDTHCAQGSGLVGQRGFRMSSVLLFFVYRDILFCKNFLGCRDNQVAGMKGTGDECK